MFNKNRKILRINQCKIKKRQTTFHQFLFKIISIFVGNLKNFVQKNKLLLTILKILRKKQLLVL